MKKEGRISSEVVMEEMGYVCVTDRYREIVEWCVYGGGGYILVGILT